MSDHANGIWYVRNLHLFKGLTPRELNELERLLDRREYRRGDVIFQMGERADSLYFLGRGTVSIQRRVACRRGAHSQNFQPRRHTFGDLFLGQDRRRLGTARALY